MFKTLALVGSAWAATDSQACMYCKRADTNAGFMTEFSYCPDPEDEQCFKNFWEYIQPTMQCVSDPKDGWTIDIDSDCAALEAGPGLCPTEFVSDKSQYGTTLPGRSVLLGENVKCTIMVDGNAGVARATFTGTNNLGVLYPGYIMG